MFYYIFCDKKIKVRDTAVKTAVFPQYVEMTPEQVEFYLANPTASVEEIKKCELIEIERIPLDKYKIDSINAISSYSLNVSRTIIPDYKVQNAIVCLNTNCGNHIYPSEECQSILNSYNNIGKTCRDMFYSYKTRIEDCATHEEVDTITTEAYNEYTKLLNNETKL